MHPKVLVSLIVAMLASAACTDPGGGDGGTPQCTPNCPRGTHQVGCDCVQNCSSNQSTIQFTNNLSKPMQASLLNGNSFVITTPTLQPGETSQKFTFTVPNGSFTFHTGFIAPPTPNQQFPNQWQCSYPLQTVACTDYQISCP